MSRSRKIRIKWFRLAVFFIAGYFLYLIIGQHNQLSAIEAENRAAHQRLEQAKQVNASLVEERNQLNNPAYIEKIAREELGLVKPGERSEEHTSELQSPVGKKLIPRQHFLTHFLGQEYNMVAKHSFLRRKFD